MLRCMWAMIYMQIIIKIADTTPIFISVGAGARIILGTIVGMTRGTMVLHGTIHITDITADGTIRGIIEEAGTVRGIIAVGILLGIPMDGMTRGIMAEDTIKVITMDIIRRYPEADRVGVRAITEPAIQTACILLGKAPEE